MQRLNIKRYAESVIIHTDGRDFHALIGDPDMDGPARIGATYDLIEAGLPIHGHWILRDQFGRHAESDATTLCLSGRLAVQWVEA